MFSSIIRLVCSIAALTFALSVTARADEGARLTTVAAENGFTYQWMPTEAGATLARPGVRIVIRAGRLFYEVNNATPIADRAPRFDGRDLVISQKLAAHLREIARSYPYPAFQAVSGTFSGESLAITTQAAARGALTLDARQIPGREAVALRGTGPGNAPVTITLTGEISNELPVVVLSRKTITTATDGSFFADIYIGQDPHPRTTIVATATSVSGVSPAEARVIIGVLSPEIKSSELDDWPKK